MLKSSRGLPVLSLVAFSSLALAKTRPPVYYDEGYRVISFTTLGGFNYKPSTHELPENVKALDGQKVTLAGYMMPLEIDEHHIVKSLAVLPHLASCCFGGSPKINMWVLVITDDHTRMPVIDDFGYGAPIYVYGTMEVGEKDSPDTGPSLYRLRADKVVAPSS